MCIVIDTCAFASTFNINALDHSEFSPVLKWLAEGKGKIVYGGARYKMELGKARNYYKFFRTLERSGKVVLVDDTKVDRIEKQIQQIIASNSSYHQFNDTHIVAIIIISKCLLVCTKNLRHTKFIRRSEFYPRGIKRPSIYCGKRNENLLNDSYIANICKPTIQGSSALMNLFGR